MSRGVGPPYLPEAWAAASCLPWDLAFLAHLLSRLMMESHLPNGDAARGLLVSACVHPCLRGWAGRQTARSLWTSKVALV